VFCEKCKAFCDQATNFFSRKLAKEEDFAHISITLHDNFTELEASSARRCQLCPIIWVAARSDSCVCSPRAAHRVLMTAHLVYKNSAIGARWCSCHNGIRMNSVDPFLRSPIWDWDAVTDEDALDDDNTRSDCTFNLVSSWVEKCLTNHTACRNINVTESPLPTRVIDVGLLNGTLLPKLIEGCGRYGKYAALSYCWGPPSGPKPLRTILSTLQARHSSIPLAILPTIFVHALHICCKLNIPYLWIDSLCIIQDSVSD
jgi:hypothetical protein